MRDSIRSGILGLAVADALGVPLEFRSRRELAADPVTGMRGYGTYNQPAGTWSDDTSMTLCVADSLAGGLDYTDMMERFRRWANEGEYTPFGQAFDIGGATSRAVGRYCGGMEPLCCGGCGERDCGNGSLMRALPVAFYLYAQYGADISSDVCMEVVHQTSSLTHNHPRCHIACGIYTLTAVRLLAGDSLSEAVGQGTAQATAYYANSAAYKKELGCFARLTDGTLATLAEDDIRSSGYVVDTLEAAFWCLLTTASYSECVLKAVNLGEDTDTVAAVAGGLAGLAYGESGIPRDWLGALKGRPVIDAVCARLRDGLKHMQENMD